MTARGDAGLRVLHLNNADIVGGGAAIAAHRLHRSLIAAGIESHMCVGAKASDDPAVDVLEHPRAARRVLAKLGHELGLNELSGIAAYTLPRRDRLREADVVHAHALEGSWFSYPALVRISAAKPTVMTLHDMWPFTGHCSYTYDCERWRTGCGRCPYLGTFPASKRDATAVEWRLKRSVWRHAELTLVSPSEWLAEAARESTMGRFPVHHIPYGIDHEVFAPIDRRAGRAEHGIDDRHLVLMAAASSLGAPRGAEINRKGSDLLLAALGALDPSLRSTCTVLLMGSSTRWAVAHLEALGYHVVDAGYVVDDAAKARLYGTADLFLCPTRADNSPLVNLEAMACGTPVAAFDVGGVGETVRPGDTGLLLPAGDVDALSDALEHAHTDRDALRALGERSRARILAEHSEEQAVARHRALYERIRS